ncbi:alpha/beta hydrolase [uncultured Limosilactobacillus sp.]|uniref:alpha/beta hydrolase n=1 Tax=uncultured Limosilactobacillus sp. TaxID=2837629 RepID=UPI0025E9323A|nr:alpha/beta hydrolase [uncultured Limosilactobacillus sp.]
MKWRRLFSDQNNSRKKNRLIITMVSLVLIMLFIPTYFWTKTNHKVMYDRYNSRMSPIIMVPGSSASINRFNSLVSLLNQDTNRKHSLLKIEVENNGKLEYSGKINKNDREPIIVAGFENNHDGYSNIKKQATMLNQAFKSLSTRYHFNNFKAFGHSNGGLIWTRWIETYYADYSDQIELKTLMTVGTPYNFDETSTSRPTQMLSDFIKNRRKIPTDLNVFAIIGTQSFTSDGLVPEASAQAGKYVYQNQAKSYTTLTVSGDNAQHSSLPQNRQIIQMIEQYLMDTNRGTNNSR